MELIMKILALFGLRREQSIESITSPMDKIVQKLENFAIEQSRRSTDDELKAKEMLQRSEAEKFSAEKARKLASKYSGLTLNSVSEQ